MNSLLIFWDCNCGWNENGMHTKAPGPSLGSTALGVQQYYNMAIYGFFCI
uniref:Uncharacterized protein n=1 Tax=Anguilla anguilla TaxID=7936 RepID=A0A0E9P6F8_ANGAN